MLILMPNSCINDYSINYQLCCSSSTIQKIYFFSESVSAFLEAKPKEHGQFQKGSFTQADHDEWGNCKHMFG